MSKFSRATLCLVNNSGHLYANNYSLTLKINPRCQRTTIRLQSEKKAETAKKAEPIGVSYQNLTVGCVRETFANERRVAITPAVTQNLVKKGFKVLIEENAGALSKFPNDQYEQAGGKIVSAASVYSTSDILLKVRAPDMTVSLTN